MEPRRVDAGSRDRFIENVESDAVLPAHITARAAIRAVMGALVGRVTAGEAHRLHEALPGSVRLILARRVRERDGQPITRLDRVQFLARVAEDLGVAPAQAEQICVAVFSAARAHLPMAVTDHVENQLPRDLQELWRLPVSAVPPSWGLGPAARHDLETDLDHHVPRLPRGVTSAAAFSAVMCAFTERLSGGEASHVLLSLPASVRPLVEQCVLHRGEPGIVFGREGLIDRVAEHLAIDHAAAVPVIRAVFDAVKRILPAKEVTDVTSQLPSDLRELWA